MSARGRNYDKIKLSKNIHFGGLALLAEENSVEEIGLRRYKTELATAGTGYILLGLWSVIKVTMSMFLGEMSFKRVFSDMEILPEDYLPMMITYFAVTFVITVFIFLLHIYIGRGAIRASRGGRKRGYLVLAFIAEIFVSLTIIADIIRLFSGTAENVDTLVATIVVDMTVLSILWGMFHSNHVIKKLTKQQKAKGPCT